MMILEVDKSLEASKREEILDRIADMDARVFGNSRWGRDAFSENVFNDYDYLICAVSDAAAGKETGVLGYGLLRCFDDAEVIMIAADPARLREGIGSRILLSLLKEAAERKAKAVFLEVRESNLAARAMYQKAGFTEEGIRRGYYHDPPENAVIMKATVQHPAT